MDQWIKTRTVDDPERIKDKCPEITDKMRLMRKLIYEKFNIPPMTMATMVNDFVCLEWEFENIIKKENTDFWLPERAEQEWLIRYNISK